MSKHTSFKTGGIADTLVIPQSLKELKETLSELSKMKSPYIIMGNGSNILVAEVGYRGTIVKIGDAFAQITVNGLELEAGAGALMSTVANAAMDAGLSGFEFASGIPGSIGGAVFMNAGAYDGEMKDIVKHVVVISEDGTKELKLSADDMKFSYRYSALQNADYIVTRVKFSLTKGNKADIKAKMRELMEKRNAKQPVTLPSAGSFFKRPPGQFAGKLIEDAGLKGISVGGAKVSELHAGFIVNYDNASATDIIDLMNLVRNTVYDKFGVELEPEVRIIGELT
jgi:UDP-N-acetylmuramate dehydrogenase